MTAYEEILDKTRDLACDLESHLGLAARAREWNPNFASASEFIENPASAEDLTVSRVTNTNRLIEEYRVQSSQALIALSGSPGDATTRDAVIELVAKIAAVRTHNDALALVASL